MKEKDNTEDDIICRGFTPANDIDKNRQNEIEPGEITEEDIYEGNPGIYTLPCEEIIPLRAECIHHTKSFEFSIFKDNESENSYFGIKAISYHSGEVKISLRMLENIVRRLKKKH